MDTSTPWDRRGLKLHDRDGNEVAEVTVTGGDPARSEAYAENIVACVNGTDERTLTLKKALRPFADLLESYAERIPDDDQGGINVRVTTADIKRAQDAIANL